MRMSIDDKDTTLPGLVMTYFVTIIVWVCLFKIGWEIGLSMTGSEMGGLAGALFVPLARDIQVKFWTV